MIDQVCLHPNETKKGGETSNQLDLKRGNIGIANMYKRYRKQDRNPGWLGNAVTSAVLPLGRRASTSPIVLQRYPT